MSRRCLLANAERLPGSLDAGRLGAHRRRLLRQAAGRVLDLSTGWEPNRLAFHQGAVTALTVTGPRRPLVAVPGVPTPEVVAAVDATPPGAYDCVVVCFTLCTQDDPGALLASAAARLVPGGRLLVLEHVGGTGFTGVLQHLAGPVEQRLRAGCRFDLDIPAAARAAGLVLADCDRFRSWVAAVPTPCLAGALVALPVSAPPSPSPSRGVR